jgi:hypothetical protein
MQINFQIQCSYLHSNVIICIDVYWHIIDKKTKAAKIKTNIMLFNCGIDTVKITVLSNHKPGILSNYIRMLYNYKLDSCVRNDQTFLFKLVIRKLLSNEHW